MILEKTAAAAVRYVESGHRVFVHGSAATPTSLLTALLDRAGELSRVELVAISTLGEIDWKRPGVTESFFLSSLFVSANVREWVDGPDGDYVPVFLSEIPALFRSARMPIDV